MWKNVTFIFIGHLRILKHTHTHPLMYARCIVRYNQMSIFFFWNHAWSSLMPFSLVVLNVPNQCVCLRIFFVRSAEDKKLNSLFPDEMMKQKLWKSHKRIQNNHKLLCCGWWLMISKVTWRRINKIWLNVKIFLPLVFSFFFICQIFGITLSAGGLQFCLQMNMRFSFQSVQCDDGMEFMLCILILFAYSSYKFYLKGEHRNWHVYITFLCVCLWTIYILHEFISTAWFHPWSFQFEFPKSHLESSCIHEFTPFCC